MDQAICDKLNTFFSQHTSQTYRKGEILIRADENPSGVLYLTKGTVKVYSISEKGDEVIVNMFKPDSFFPMSWALNDVSNIYFYEAVSDVHIWKASRKPVITFLQNNPEVLLDLLSRVYKGLDGLLLRMTYLMSGSAYSRLVVEILIAAKRFGKQHGDHIIINISEKDLALQAGLTRETVSREMGTLKRKGLIAFDKKILEITNIESLKNELQHSSRMSQL